MKPEDRQRLVFLVVNACLAATLVVLQDPELRRSWAEGLARWRHRARGWYLARVGPEPDPREVSAVIAEAERLVHDERG